MSKKPTKTERLALRSGSRTNTKGSSRTAKATKPVFIHERVATWRVTELEWESPNKGTRLDYLVLGKNVQEVIEVVGTAPNRQIIEIVRGGFIFEGPNDKYRVQEAFQPTEDDVPGW